MQKDRGLCFFKNVFYDDALKNKTIAWENPVDFYSLVIASL